VLQIEVIEIQLEFAVGKFGLEDKRVRFELINSIIKLYYILNFTLKCAVDI
jgi:hypothetical protein